VVASPEIILIRSRSELGVQLYRAAIGAGLPLGDAEDLLQAAPYLSKEDVTLIAQDLDQKGRRIRDLSVSLDKVACGKEIPPLGTLGIAFAQFRGLKLKEGTTVWPKTNDKGDRIEIEVEIWERLDYYARKIYVQENMHSRLTGAGAGTEED